jgi:hypothetical protein
MALCKWCTKSGWFLSIDASGLCSQCAKIIKLEVRQRMRIINDSVQIVNNSKNIDTRLSRLNLIYEHLNALHKFEQLGVDVVKPPPSIALEQLKGKKDQIILEAMRNAVEQAETKSSIAKTIQSKISPLSKTLLKIAEYENKLDDPKLLSDLEQHVNNAIETVQKNGKMVCIQGERDITEQYYMSATEKRKKIEQDVVDCLVKRAFMEASVIVATFEAEQPVTRGLGIDWKHFDNKRQVEILSLIFQSKPEILSNLDDANLEALRVGAAMMELWGMNTAKKWIPVNLKTGLLMSNDSAARMVLFDSRHKQTLKQYAEHGAIQYVEVLATADSCEDCKKLQGKRYRIDEAPTLPNPNCTHELGCRCVYLPCIK